MILSDIEAEIFRGLKEPSTGGHWSESEILRRINMGQRRIVRLTGCMKDTYTATTVVGQSSYTKPTVCLRVERVYYQYLGNKLWPISIADLDLLSENGTIDDPWTGTQDEPTHYYQSLKNIYLYPKPDAATTLGVEVLVRPTDLASASDIPFDSLNYMYDYHDLLVPYVLWRCLLEDQNPAFEQHKKEFAEGIAEIKNCLQQDGEALKTFSLVTAKSSSKRMPLPALE